MVKKGKKERKRKKEKERERKGKEEKGTIYYIPPLFYTLR